MVERLESIGARNTRHASLSGEPHRGDLVAHGVNRLGRGTDELQALLHAEPRECGLLREKAVSRMHRFAPGSLGRCNEDFRAQIALGRARRTNTHRVGREPRGKAIPVGFRNRRDCLDAELRAGANHPDRDLTPIGDKHALKGAPRH